MYAFVVCMCAVCVCSVCIKCWWVRWWSAAILVDVICHQRKNVQGVGL